MKLSDFTYDLPPELIAKVPAKPRDSSKLLVLDKYTGKITDDYFFNLASYLKAGDLLVRNNTKVIPARIFGKKESGGKIEILLNKKVAQYGMKETWECLTKPGIKPGQKILFNSALFGVCKSKNQKKYSRDYTREIEFNQTGFKFLQTLEKIGITPLPPYISDKTVSSKKIRKQYQTIYAKYEGSVAAPTAGLHFTNDLEKSLKNKGVKIAEVTLHVGLGTFLPVKTENILQHHMHSEWYEIESQVATLINKTIQAGGRVICVGTTSARTIESAIKYENNKYFVEPKIDETEIFIYPGYEYKIVDGLVTNFHLPKSTLLMLVSALVSKPNTNKFFSTFLESNVGKAYLHAIKHDYRFYSFGDGMLIL